MTVASTWPPHRIEPRDAESHQLWQDCLDSSPPVEIPSRFGFSLRGCLSFEFFFGGEGGMEGGIFGMGCRVGGGELDERGGGEREREGERENERALTPSAGYSVAWSRT